MAPRVVVYGVEGSSDTMRARTHLDTRGIAYVFVDLDFDEIAAKNVMSWNNGQRVVPTIEITDSTGESFRIAEPSNEELDHLLRRSAA